MEKPAFNAEIDFRDLLRHPWKLLGYGYVYFFVVLVAIGLVYVFNLTEIGKNTVPARVLSDSSAFVQDIPFQSPAVIPPVDVKVVGRPSDSLIASGRTVFQANCASCHGDNGQGDGAGGAALNPKPRNFHSINGWTNGAKVSEIYRTLEEGIVKNGMASYNYLPAKDRFALAHLIRTWVPGAPIDAESDLQNLETVYQLSKGQVRPAQIPVKKATQILLKENAPMVAAVEKRTSARGSDPGATVFARVVADPQKALTALTARGYRASSVDELVKLVSADPVKIGFKAGVTRLSAEEWAALHQYLARLSAS